MLAVAYDNSVTGGGDPFTEISDDIGNLWTPRLEVLNDPGAANAGLVLRLWETEQNVGALVITSIITLSFSPNVGARVATLTELTANNGHITYVTGGTGTGNSSTPSIVTGTIPSGDYVFGATGQEGGGVQTGDSDTTNGSWSTQQHTVTTGTGDANQGITTQGKVVTGSGTQTYNTTINAARDWAILWAQYTEIVIGKGKLFSPRLERPTKVSI